jgi:NAD(P)-dependent dehydrogenase (short-subunit alcohol dehydrogenase family)
MGSVLVAGGTGALGAGVLRALLEGGCPVTATWVVETERERVEKAFEGADGLSLVRADLMEAEGAEAAVAATQDLGAVVNLVGGFAAGPLAHETDIEDYERMLRLNLRPGFLLARAAFPTLIEAGGGAYVGVSARPALQPFPGSAAYATAKAAVLAFVTALAADYRAHGIRCNAILPSVIDTPANRAATPDADFSKWVAPDEIGRVVRFLVSDDSAPTSGAAIPVYGRA